MTLLKAIKAFELVKRPHWLESIFLDKNGFFCWNDNTESMWVPNIEDLKATDWERG